MRRTHILSGRAAFSILMAVFVILLLAKAYPFINRIFNWDELGLLSISWTHLTEGWRSESRPGLVYVLMWPLFWLFDNQIAIMYGARAINMLAFVALCSGTFAVARRLYGRAAGVMALVLISFHSLFFAHSVEVRTETFAVALALWGIVWAETRAGKGRSVWPGLIPIAVGGLASQKAIYPLVWYAVGHLVGAGRRWRLREQRGLAVALVAPPVLFVAAVAIALPLAEVLPYLRRLTLGAIEEVRSPFYIEWVQWTYPKWSLDREPAFYLAPVLAIPLLVRRSLRPRWRLWASVAQQLTVVGILWFHAARFPYFSLTLAPLFAIPSGYQLALALGALGRWGGKIGAHAFPAIGLVAMVAALAVPFYDQLPELFKDTGDSQMQMVDRLQRLFPPGTPAFDAHHLMIFHGHAATPMYSRAVAFMKKEPAAMKAFVDQLRAAAPVYYIQSKRTEKLTGDARRFLKEHFVRVAPNLYLSGRNLDKPGKVEILVEGDYQIGPRVKEWRVKERPPLWPKGGVKVDGRPIGRGRKIRLETGIHTVEWQGAGGVRLRLSWPGIAKIEAPSKGNWQLYRPYK